jgi:hypothetical protein
MTTSTETMAQMTMIKMMMVKIATNKLVKPKKTIKSQKTWISGNKFKNLKRKSLLLKDLRKTKRQSPY